MAGIKNDLSQFLYREIDDVELFNQSINDPLPIQAKLSYHSISLPGLFAFVISLLYVVLLSLWVLHRVRGSQQSTY